MAASVDDVFTISAVVAMIALETIGEAETVPVACLSATPERSRASTVETAHLSSSPKEEADAAVELDREEVRALQALFRIPSCRLLLPTSPCFNASPRPAREADWLGAANAGRAIARIASRAKKEVYIL